MIVNIDRTCGVLIVLAMLSLVLLGYVLQKDKHENEMDYIMAEVVAATKTIEKCNEYMDIFEWVLDENPELLKETP